MESPTPAAFAARQGQRDLLVVAKAAQAISDELAPDDIIKALMLAVIEHSGARKGSLLLTHGEELSLAADAHVDQQGVSVRTYWGQAPPAKDLPGLILDYVRHRREKVSAV